MLNVTEKPDVFISHASPDKTTFVRPLAEALRKLGVSVWYDEFSLELGDSISQHIDRGIANSRFGIVVVSPAFISRNWTKHELRALVSRDVDQEIRILPVWHGVTKKEVSDFSPSLADKVAIDTSRVDAMEAAIRILRTVRPDLYSAHPRSELERLASGSAIAELQAEIECLHSELEEYQCPYCGAGLSTRANGPMDEEQKHWDVVEVFDCGFRRYGGSVDRPCPHDPQFPQLEDYDIVILPRPLHGDEGFTAMARPKDGHGRKVSHRRRLGCNRRSGSDPPQGQLSLRRWQDHERRMVQDNFGLASTTASQYRRLDRSLLGTARSRWSKRRA